MYIKCQVNPFTQILSARLKESYENQTQGTIKYNFSGVLKKAYLSIRDKKIDWIEVDNQAHMLSFTEDEALQKKAYSTNINISNDLEKYISELSQELKETFSVKRIFLSAVIRYIITAGYLYDTDKLPVLSD